MKEMVNRDLTELYFANSQGESNSIDKDSSAQLNTINKAAGRNRLRQWIAWSIKLMR